MKLDKESIAVIVGATGLVMTELERGQKNLLDKGYNPSIEQLSPKDPEVIAEGNATAKRVVEGLYNYYMDKVSQEKCCRLLAKWTEEKLLPQAMQLIVAAHVMGINREQVLKMMEEQLSNQ